MAFLGGGMETVNPNDIENIEVSERCVINSHLRSARLKRRNTWLQPGSQKLVSTKISVNINSGFAVSPKKLDVLNASQYIDYVQEALTNAGASYYL